MKVLLNFLITGWTIFVHCRHLQRIILLDVFCSDPFQIEYSQLSAVAQFKFFQDGAQVIADRAFAEMVSPGNLPVAQPLGHKLNDALLPFADAVFSKVTLPAAFQQPGEPGHDGIAEDALALVDRLQGGDDAFKILLQDVALCAQPERLDNIFVIGKGGQEKDARGGTVPGSARRPAAPSSHPCGYP